MEWADGRKFKGSWKSDKKHGYGIHTNADGSTISGTWINNKQHGFGVYVSVEQKRKYGAWSYGKKIETLAEEKVKRLISGEIEAKSFIQATDIEWAEILSYSSKLFYANL